MKNWLKQVTPSLFMALLVAGAYYWLYGQKQLLFSGIEVISAPYAHAKNITGKGVNIAVIDQGFDKDHNLLSNNFSHLRYNGDFNNWDVSEMGGWVDGKFVMTTHGTHVSGIIAGADKTIGVAPEAKLIPIKMGMMGGEQAIVRALEMARNSPADIVNISMQLSHSGNFLNPNVREALIKLAASGKIIVVAAGNSGASMTYNRYTRGLMELAHNPEMQGRMIIVGATTYKDYAENLAKFSNFPSRSFGLYDVSYFITAPGDQITSTMFGNETGTMSGTSMAAPMVSGSLAILKQSFPHLAPEELVLLLLKSARQHQLGTNVLLNRAYYGHGVVDIEAAIKLGHKLML